MVFEAYLWTRINAVIAYLKLILALRGFSLESKWWNSYSKITRIE